jgi:hypothetical protein
MSKLVFEGHSVYRDGVFLGEYQDWRFLPSVALLEMLGTEHGVIDSVASKRLYYAFQVYTADGEVRPAVERHPSELWARLCCALNGAHDGIDAIEVGAVVADDIAMALDEVRAERWVSGTRGLAYAGETRYACRAEDTP